MARYLPKMLETSPIGTLFSLCCSSHTKKWDLDPWSWNLIDMWVLQWMFFESSKTKKMCCGCYCIDQKFFLELWDSMKSLVTQRLPWGEEAKPWARFPTLVPVLESFSPVTTLENHWPVWWVQTDGARLFPSFESSRRKFQMLSDKDKLSLSCEALVSAHGDIIGCNRVKHNKMVISAARLWNNLSHTNAIYILLHESHQYYYYR
jgi:hypothetical protein